MSTYTPDPTNDPVSITIPDDGDVPDVASVNAAFEGLADMIAARRMKIDVFNANGTWTCPVGVAWVIIIGWGGGGGGGGGAGSTNTTARQAGGGAGGGGAQRSVQHVAVTPTTVYNVVRGAGGAGGAGGAAATAGTRGSDGGFSAFGASGCYFAGGSGGAGGLPNVNTGTESAVAFGGGPVDSNVTPAAVKSSAEILEPLSLMRSTTPIPGAGGDAHVNVNFNLTTWGSDGAPGYGSPTWDPGGNGGTEGAVSGSYKGGGGGGGGGAGPVDWSTSPNGGDGGIANNAGDGAGGSFGIAPAANTGAGGGGGGGGGAGSGSPQLGGNGAAGASGRVIVIYQGKQAVVA